MWSSEGGRGHLPSQPDQLNQSGDQWGERCCSQITLTSTHQVLLRRILKFMMYIIHLIFHHRDKIKMTLAPQSRPVTSPCQSLRQIMGGRCSEEEGRKGRVVMNVNSSVPLDPQLLYL